VLIYAGNGIPDLILPKHPAPDHRFSTKKSLPCLDFPTKLKLMKKLYTLVLLFLFAQATVSLAVTKSHNPVTCSVTVTTTNATCNGLCNGSAIANPIGGTAPYTYSWATLSGTRDTVTNICAGTYTLFVTDNFGCSSSATFTIGQPVVLTNTLHSQTNLKCNGVCNGKAVFNAAGGTGPYLYSWLPAGSSTDSATNLCSGTYTVVVTDQNGCKDTNMVILTQPSALVSSIVSYSNLKCNGQCRGKAKVGVTGGTMPYHYSWTPVGGTKDSARTLCAGTSTVTITDTAGCVSKDTVTLTEPAALVLTPTQHNVTCNGGADGFAVATVSGGTGAYTYSWLPSPFPIGLAAGPEFCLVTDSNGCRINHLFPITQPPAIVPTVSAKPASCGTCNDGRDSVAVTGGKGAYTYSWSPGGCTSPLCTGLAPGTYSCCVTDSAGCTVCQTVNVSVLGITEMEAPSMYIFPNPAGDYLNIQIPSQYNIQGLGLFSSVGQEILEISDFKSSLLDVSRLKPGIYLLRLYYPGGSMHKLFIKE
jgi:hypothetical protein